MCNSSAKNSPADSRRKETLIFAEKKSIIFDPVTERSQSQNTKRELENKMRYLIH